MHFFIFQLSYSYSYCFSVSISVITFLSCSYDFFVLQFGTATKIEKKIQLELKTKRYA